MKLSLYVVCTLLSACQKVRTSPFSRESCWAPLPSSRQQKCQPARQGAAPWPLTAPACCRLPHSLLEPNLGSSATERWGEQRQETVRLEAARPWPAQGGVAPGVPLSLKPLAQPPPSLLPQECRPGWGTQGSQLQPRVLATLAMREEGEMEGGRRSWPGQWGRDQIASSSPRHRLPLGTGACSASQHFLPLLHVPTGDLILGWGQEVQLGLWGLKSPQRLHQSAFSLG